jgi:hypothetical protein
MSAAEPSGHSASRLLFPQVLIGLYPATSNDYPMTIIILSEAKELSSSAALTSLG